MSKVFLQFIIFGLFFHGFVNGLELFNESTTSEAGINSCEPIHAQGHGINLVCCNRAFPVTSDCQFRPLCRTTFCRCHVTVSADLGCHLQTSFQPTVLWADHTPPSSFPFDCFNPGFPNPAADYSLTLMAFNRSLTPLLLTGLTSYNVTSLIIDSTLPESFEKLNFSKHFPYLHTLSIKAPLEESRPFIGNLHTLFGNLPHLEHISLFHVNFEFGKEPKWLPSLTRLHIENSNNFEELPKWFSFAKNLKKLTIRKTKLKSTLIGSIGAHTFLQCESLRILDISDNKIKFLPPKPFQLNSKLKFLNLAFNEIEELQMEHFIGLETLRTLSLSNNPIKGVEPFAFLPLSKSLRSLKLNACNLTRIPLAITQCCLLESLEINDNRFFEADSMPPEILALIAEIKHLEFEMNPLMKLPEGLFLFPPGNEATLSHILDTLIQLPVWRKEPCTPFMWHIHLSNSSSNLRRKVAIWDKNRMRRENLKHCEFLYERIIENLSLYRELAENSGCEANRRLRRVRESCKKCQKDRKHSSRKTKTDEKPAVSPSGVVVVEKAMIEETKNKEIEIEIEHDYVLASSLLANIIFTVVFVSLIVYIISIRIIGGVSSSNDRTGFEEIHGI
uniref:Uncharacterized protein n=1 Tax=Panagrolaimus sp. ES5 TaxID=591445 RepID=A0AC34FY58_9BILA